MYTFSEQEERFKNKYLPAQKMMAVIFCDRAGKEFMQQGTTMSDVYFKTPKITA
jgi:hypothetical protein